MTNELLYKILILETMGWVIGDKEKDVKLTKKEGVNRYNYYLSEGIAPNRIQIQVDAK